MVSRVFNNDNIDGRSNNKNNSRSVTLSKVRNEIVIFVNNFYKLIFFIKKKVLAQIIIDGGINYIKQKVVQKKNFLLLNKLTDLLS